MELGKFYQDLHTESVTTAELLTALNAHPHCVILEGSGDNLFKRKELLLHRNRSSRTMKFQDQMFPGRVPCAFHFTTYDFGLEGVCFTRIGISGTDLILNPKTGEKDRVVARFHRAISKEELLSTVQSQRIPKELCGTAAKVQGAFKCFFKQTIHAQAKAAHGHFEQYEVDMAVRYFEGKEFSSQDVADASKFIGIMLHNCIFFGHRSFDAQTNFLEAGFKIRLSEEQQVAGHKRPVDSETSRGPSKLHRT